MSAKSLYKIIILAVLCLILHETIFGCLDKSSGMRVQLLSEKKNGFRVWEGEKNDKHSLNTRRNGVRPKQSRPKEQLPDAFGKKLPGKKGLIENEELNKNVYLASRLFQNLFSIEEKEDNNNSSTRIVILKKHLTNSSKAQNTIKELSFLSLKIDSCHHMSWIDRLEVCQHHLNWEERNLNKSKRTSVKHSLVKVFLADSAGMLNMLYIKTYTLDNKVKTRGGDYFRSFLIEGSKNFKVNINLFDLNNGEYSGVFQIPQPGNYELQITLEYSVCEGMTDPPSNWFTKGTKFISQPPLVLTAIFVIAAKVNDNVRTVFFIMKNQYLPFSIVRASV